MNKEMNAFQSKTAPTRLRKFIKPRWIRKGMIATGSDGKPILGEEAIGRIVARIQSKGEQSTDRLQRRLEFAELLQEKAEGGRVAIISGGRDCDGVESYGEKTVADASVIKVEAILEEMYRWAEGPVWWEIKSPSFESERTTRDRTLEAFENGHPHCI